jgi:O-antigen/teichoic acid export membrane protein
MSISLYRQKDRNASYFVSPLFKPDSSDSFDKISLKQYSTYEQLGLYAAAFKIIALLGVVQNIFTTTWIPVAYQWYENNEDQKKFESVSVVVLATVSIFFVCIVVFRDIIFLFLGSEYRNTSLIFIYLLFVPAMYTISETTNLGIAFSKKTKYNIYISLICVGINVFGNFMLIPIFGAKGAAISTCVSYIIFFWARTMFSRKLWYKFSLSKYIINITLLILLILSIELHFHKIIEIVFLICVVLANCYFLKNIIIPNKNLL